jgi:hypothetical protein
VLPALQRLSLQLAMQGGMPPEWAHGFLALESMTLLQPYATWAVSQPADEGAGSGRDAPTSAPAPASSLPEQWTAGFPRLQHLMLEGLALAGTLPAAWLQLGSFPSLTSL